ncbi:WD40 repeat-like protein [Cutaneotrichosporon oleaginosum]|uniref:WD40 repeat-like protein n=1 Tax=Cutaneotrichosporon oleaginosum TaxID=879819 RepID=A0A0J0XGU0_9TREE|nr:WD40 repeat-like protein [Cutaneotrichosporon oleaginosum]KLT40286.1 WD40 repeat-like protein [Cutaneotrichosporon oleaginosum]TXT08001.1 hypothetical protein COLE_04925 [Cutaneotrichosporon oleaginosum]
MPAPASGGADSLSFPSKLARTLEHQGAVNVVTYNHGAKYLLSGSSDRTIRLWNPILGKEIKAYKGHAHEILALDISHDNARFASCGGDKVVLLWDVMSGQVLRRMQGHFGKINAVAFNNDGGILASAGFDAKILLWDMRSQTRDPLQTLKDATSSITSLVIPPDSVEIIAGSADGHVRAYDMRMGKVFEDTIGRELLFPNVKLTEDPVTAVTTSPSNHRETMLVAAADGKLRLFDRMNGKVLQTFSGYKVGQTRSKPAFNRGEGAVIAGDEDGSLWSWGVLDAKPLNGGPAQVHKRAITSVIMNPNGREMVTASLDGTIKIWST